jgi:hypothetical protein
MFIVCGKRLFGKVDRCGPSCIATRFVHVYWIPLIPLGSHMVIAESGRQFQGIPVGLHWRSTLAGYLRTWGPLALLWQIAALAGFGVICHVERGLWCALWTAGCAAATVVGWAIQGPLSLDEKAIRLVYRDYVGFCGDPAGLCGPERERFRARLLEKVLPLTPVTAANYRTPPREWLESLEDPAIEAPQFLSAGMTLARVEASLAEGPRRARLMKAHGAAWQKLKRVNQLYLEWASRA